MAVRLATIGAALAAALGLAVAGPAGASGTGTFAQVNLVSDQPGAAALTDPDLVNAWGISHGPNTPVWVSNNGTGTTTLYRTDVAGAPVTKVLSVTIPGGAPTGQVFNGTAAFIVPGTGLPARFVFAGENGDLSAWNGGSSAVLVHHTEGAVYKGLALVPGSSGPLLLAANFHDGRIDAFDGTFALVSTPDMFRDPFLPAGYAPFNVALVDDRVFVAYAQQDAARHDDVAGKAHGFVDVFTADGALTQRFATRGVLDSPWGMTIAPDSFGQFAGDLLIGNFGDGRIHAFDPRTGDVLGVLRGTTGMPLVIEGLWGLQVGDPVAGGTDSVWFSAGPDDEQHGLFGLLQPVQG